MYCSETCSVVQRCSTKKMANIPTVNMLQMLQQVMPVNSSNYVAAITHQISQSGL